MIKYSLYTVSLFNRTNFIKHFIISVFNVNHVDVNEQLKIFDIVKINIINVVICEKYDCTKVAVWFVKMNKIDVCPML